MKLYSPARNAFYLSALKAEYGDNWPADAIEVTEKEFQAYSLAQPPTGKQRGADANGRPCWVDLPAASIDDLAAAAMARINAGYVKAMGVILAEYPDAETLSFDKQEAQARAWAEWQENGGTEPATPYLDAMLAERPIGKAELVARIVTKADQFTAAHGQATGRRQKLEDDVKAAQLAGDRTTLETITW